MMASQEDGAFYENGLEKGQPKESFKKFFWAFDV